MIFALLGDIKIGDAAWTGPTAATEKREAVLVEHEVARGKQPIQDMGDNNDTKSLQFFFDETFCDPQTELAKLEAAFAARSALAYVAGDGAFNGVRYVVKSLSVETLRSTPYGRPVRMAIGVELLEAGGLSLSSILASAARSGATAIRSATSKVGSKR
jgi:phage protein U